MSRSITELLPDISKSALWRLAIIFPIFVGQHYLLTISFDFSTLTGGLWTGLLFLERQILAMVPLAAGVFFLLVYAHAEQEGAPNYKASVNPQWSLSLLTEIVGFTALLLFTPRLFTFLHAQGVVPKSITFTYLLLTIAVFFLALRSLHSLSVWRHLP